jgi:chromosome segregation ATPase
MKYWLALIGFFIFLYQIHRLIGAIKNMSEQVIELNNSIGELQASIAAEKAEGHARVATLEAKVADLEAKLAALEGVPDLSEEIAAIRQATADVSAIFETPNGPPDEEVAPPEMVG